MSFFISLYFICHSDRVVVSAADESYVNESNIWRDVTNNKPGTFDERYCRLDHQSQLTLRII